MPLSLRTTPDGVTFAVKAVPGSSRDRIVGLHGDALKVTVAAPPERGKANASIAALIARALDLPPASVAVVAGLAHAHKQVRVRGRTAAEIARLLGIE